jgi:hypothetical protein
MATVKNLDLRAAVLLSIWILVAAFTLAELGTVQPALREAGLRAERAREGGPRVLEARARPLRRGLLAR